MPNQLTLLKIVDSIVKPLAKVPLSKLLPEYPAEIKEIEDVINKIISGNEIVVLSWLNKNFRGLNLGLSLYLMEDTYKSVLYTQKTGINIWDISSNLKDGLQAVYCFIEKMPVIETNKKDTLRYFRWSRVESKLSFLIMAYGIAFLILRAFEAKMRELNKRKPRIQVPFECRQCGRCCLKYGNCLKAYKEDIDLWERAGRTNILNWVGVNGDLWINSSTGKEAQRCPFLRKVKGKDRYICHIYDAKPKVCREYPVSKKQALKDRCLGLIYNAEKEKTQIVEQREDSADCQTVQKDNSGDRAARSDGGGTPANGTQPPAAPETENQTATQEH